MTDKTLNTIDLMFNIVFACITLIAMIYLVYFVIRLVKEIVHSGKNNNGRKKIKTNVSGNNFDYSQGYKIDDQYNDVYMNQMSATTKYSQNTVQIHDDVEHIQIGFSTILGTRKSQQDSVIASDRKNLTEFNFQKGIVVLGDGMGGMSGGEIASKISVKTMYDDYVEEQPKKIPDFFRKEIKKVDNLVSNLRDENNNIMESGSTIVCAVVENDDLYWVSVGDSRIYIIRDNAIVQVTTDHNYYYILKQKADSGIISQEEALNNPNAEALISYIGIGRDCPIDISEQPFKLQNGDIVLLCSDGLYKTLTDKAILRITTENSYDVEKAADMLTNEVLNANKKSQDNTTVALLKYSC